MMWCFWRALFASLIVGFYLLLSKRNFLRGIRSGDFLLFILFGSVGIGFNYLGFIASLNYLKVATALLILYTFPSMVVILGSFFLGERISRVKVISLVLSMLGLSILLGWDISFSPVGYAWAFLSAVGNATYALVGRKLSGRVDSMKALFWGFSFGALFLLIILLLTKGVVRVPELRELKYLLGLSFLSTFLPYMFFLFSFKYLEAGKASIGALSEIPLTTFLAFLFFGESLGFNHIFGGSLVVLSIILLMKGGG